MLRRVPLYRSFWKPILWMGCERAPFMVIAGTSAVIILQGGLWIKIIGVIYFIFGVGIIAIVNTYDPFYFHILWRYKSQQDYYPNNAMYPGRQDKPKNFA